MKKNNLIKILAICFLFVLVISWIIPVGAEKSTEPIGIVNIFRTPVLTLQTFIQYFISFISIGAFYGVLNGTGVFSKSVDKVSKTWSNKPKTFMILTIILFALLSSLSGSTMFLFVLVPFFAAVLLSLGYKNLTTLLATIGSILAGQIGSIYGFNIVGYYVNMLSVGINDNVLVRIILFVTSLVVYILFVSKNSENLSKKQKNIESKNVIPFYSNNKTEQSLVPFIVISVIVLLITFIGSYNWYYSFGIEAFDNFTTKLNEITIGSYPLVQNLIYGFTNLGYWGNYEIAIMLFASSALLGWVYNLSIDEYIENLKEGSKKMLKTAFIATMASIIFMCMLNTTDGTMVETICGWLTGISDSFNIAITSLISLVGGLFYNDYYYILSSAQSIFTAYSTETISLTGILSGAIYGLLMLILPTSVYLAAGLTLFDVSYKDWFKNIWKYVLIMLISIIVLITLAYVI